jgi:hypothetical protein
MGLKKVKQTNDHRGPPAEASSLTSKKPAVSGFLEQFAVYQTLWRADSAQYAGSCVNNDGYVLLTIACRYAPQARSTADRGYGKTASVRCPNRPEPRGTNWRRILFATVS